MIEAIVKALRGMWDVKRVDRRNLAEAAELHTLVTSTLVDTLNAVFQRLHRKGFAVNGIAAIVGAFCLDIAARNGGIPDIIAFGLMDERDDDGLDIPPPPEDPTLN